MALVNKTLSAIRSVATFLCVVLNFASFHIYAATEVPNTFNSGTPALASEVNENFSSVVSSIDSHYSRFPDRYYPDWRHDPSFYLQLPTLGGFWGGRLLSETHLDARSNRNLNFVNRYEPADGYTDKRIFLGLSIAPAADAAASQLSKAKGQSDAFTEPVNLYTFSMIQHLDDNVRNRILYTEDESLLGTRYPPVQGIWRFYMSREQVEEMLPKIYSLLKLSSNEIAVSCGIITLHMNSDLTIDVSGDGCVEIGTVVPG
jgi:hypothetical protein